MMSAEHGSTVGYDAAYIAEFPAFIDKWTRVAMNWAEDQLVRHGGEIAVVAPDMSYFRDGPLMGLPRPVRRASFKTLASKPLPSIAIVLYPTPAALEKVDERCATIRAALVLPYSVPEEIAAWAVAHRALKIAGNSEVEFMAQIDNPVVRVALSNLTEMVNKSTGLAHPSDESKAGWMFKHLFAAQYRWTRYEVELFAAANGWGLRHARQLAEMSERVLNGVQIRVGRDPFRSDVVDQWASEAGT